jgi:nucleoid DNA-binding protein
MRKLQEFIKNLAEEKNLSIFAVESVISHQFKFLKKCMQSDDLPDIYLKNLGRFKIKKKRLEWMIDELEKGKNNNIDKLKKAIDVRK